MHYLGTKAQSAFKSGSVNPTLQLEEKKIIGKVIIVYLIYILYIHKLCFFDIFFHESGWHSLDVFEPTDMRSNSRGGVEQVVE